jgi:integrase
VFTGERGRPVRPNLITEWFNGMAKESGLKDIGGPHGLRHTHITELIGKGWSPRAVADRVGDDVKTILEVYAHTRPGDDQALADDFAADLRAEKARLAGNLVTNLVTPAILEPETRRSAQGKGHA